MKDKIGEKLTIDITKMKDKYPKILSKSSERDNGYITIELVYEDGERYEARVLNISSSGKYSLEITKKAWHYFL